MTVRTAGLIGSGAVLVTGLWFYRADLPDDGVSGVKGSSREALKRSVSSRNSTAQPVSAT